MIAVVDDDDSLRLALVGLLRSLGYRSRGYVSSELFVESGSPSNCDCLLTDYHLPGISGLELLRTLRTEGNTTPVIVMSGRNEAGLRERAVAGGASCLLAKPFMEAELLHCLQSALLGHNQKSGASHFQRADE